MLDYAAWISRLGRFIAGVSRLSGEVSHEFTAAPPLTADVIAQLNQSLRLPVPPPVAAFLQHGSAGCSSQFYWEPDVKEAERLKDVLGSRSVFGGAPLCDSKNFGQWQEWCLEATTDMWIADAPKEKALWLNAFPFAFMSHGDFLALDVSQGSDDPPVLYLCHDDASSILSPSLDAFLSEWQRLCYIGPDLYLFERFIDPTTNFLSGESSGAGALRGVFGAVSQQ